MKLPKIADAAQLIALAAEAERRAEARYRHLAERARREGRADLAELFDWLAGQEDGHEARIRELASSPEGVQPGERELMSALGESAEPAEEAARLGRLTLYACLAEAVRREDAAFTLYSYLAAEAEDPALQSLAETLAKEELSHAQLLRAARRKAYHVAPPSFGGWPKASQINSLSHLLRAACESERRFLTSLSAGDVATTEPLWQLTRAALPELAVTGNETVGRPPAAADLLQQAEAAFEFYDAVTERAREATLLERAQALSAMALERIKLLSRVAGDDA